MFCDKAFRTVKGNDSFTSFPTHFLAQFRSSLIYVLLVAGIVTAALEMWLDSAVIFVVVIANAIIGFIQEESLGMKKEVIPLKLNLQIYMPLSWHPLKFA